MLSVALVILFALAGYVAGYAAGYLRGRPDASTMIVFAVKNGTAPERGLRMGDRYTISAPPEKPLRLKLIAIGDYRMTEGAIAYDDELDAWFEKNPGGGPLPPHLAGTRR